MGLGITLINIRITRYNKHAKFYPDLTWNDKDFGLFQQQNE